MDRLAHDSNQPRELNQLECQQVSGGLIGPDQDLNDFPRIIWPVIRVAMDAKLKSFNFQKIVF